MIKGTDRYLYFFRHLKYEILLRRSLRTWNKKKRRRRKIEGKKKIPLFLKSKTTRQQFNPSSKIQRIRTITGKIFRAIKQETRKRLTRLHCLKHNRASSREFHADLTNVNVEVSMRRVTFQPRFSPCIKKTWLSKAICFFPVLFPLSPVSSNRLDNHHWSLPSIQPQFTPLTSILSPDEPEINEGQKFTALARSRRDAILDLSADSYPPRRIITVSMIRVYDRDLLVQSINSVEREGMQNRYATRCTRGWQSAVATISQRNYRDCLSKLLRGWLLCRIIYWRP